MATLDYPADRGYTAEHEWALATAEQVTVGITAFAQDSLGDVVFVDLPGVGTEVTAGESCGEIESTKSVSELVAPLSGTVTEVNDTLDASPDLVNSDPYGNGWLYKIQPSDPGQLEALMDADAYRSQVG